MNTAVFSLAKVCVCVCGNKYRGIFSCRCVCEKDINMGQSKCDILYIANVCAVGIK